MLYVVVQKGSVAARLVQDLQDKDNIKRAFEQFGGGIKKLSGKKPIDPEKVKSFIAGAEPLHEFVSQIRENLQYAAACAQKKDDSLRGAMTAPDEWDFTFPYTLSGSRFALGVSFSSTSHSRPMAFAPRTTAARSQLPSPSALVSLPAPSLMCRLQMRSLFSVMN